MIPGGVLAIEPVRKYYATAKRHVDIQDFDGDLTLRLDLSEHMQSLIFWCGSYNRNLIYLMKRILKPGMVVVDGGANIGEISLVASKLVGNEGRVFAFEPISRLADQLQWHLDTNNVTNAQLVRSGISDSDGKAPIYVAEAPFHDGTSNDGLGTLYPSDTRSSVESTIPLITLDNFVSNQSGCKVDFIKLDIEGAELAALRGARHVLKEHRPQLVIELGELTCQVAGYSMEDVIDEIAEFDYSFFRLGRKGTCRQITKQDLGRFQNIYCVPN